MATSGSSDTCSNGVSVALSWGFEVTIGATIDVTIAGLKLGLTKDFPQTTIMSISNPIASGCASLAALSSANTNKRRLSASSIVSSTGVKPGDLFAGSVKYTGSGTKCSALFGGEPSTYLALHPRVASVLTTGSGDMVDVVATLNYAGGQSGSAKTPPFACIVQNMYTWSTYYDGSGTMTLASDQAGVSFSKCGSDGFMPPSSLGFYCTGFGSSSISCSDTTQCFSVTMHKSAGSNTCLLYTSPSPRDRG